MNRRDLLKGASLTMVAAMASRASFGATTSSPKNIIVIGAGMAGLAAARQLSGQGHQVTILEGRSRLGGRTWTSAAWADAPVDLGASWIHEMDGNPLTPLAQKAGAQLITTSYDSVVDYDVDGRPINSARKQRLDELKGEHEWAISQGQNANKDSSVRSTIEGQLDWSTLSEDDKELLSFISNSTVEQEYAGSRNELSTYWFDSMGGYAGEDAVFADGYRTLINYLASNLNVQFNQTVKSINSSTAKVSVTTNKGSFTADRVIVTVPLGVLKKGVIKFTPALPSKKTTAIAKLGMGNFNKCYLRFSSQFWPQQDWLEYIPPLAEHGKWSQWLNLGRLTGQPILLGFNAGDFGGEIEAWSDTQIVASAMQRLRQLFGNSIPEPIGYQITRWSQGPRSAMALSRSSNWAPPRSCATTWRRRLATACSSLARPPTSRCSPRCTAPIYPASRPPRWPVPDPAISSQALATHGCVASARACSRNKNFCTLPVEVLINGPNTTLPGTLKRAMCCSHQAIT